MVMLVGCATPPQLSPAAKNIQVHQHAGPLVDKCKTLGPVNVEGSSLAGGEIALDTAKVKAREEAARQGADTLAITNSEPDNTRNIPTYRVQGTALKCF